jgi:hypothetical protein
MSGRGARVHHRRPSPAVFMLRALYPSPGAARLGRFLQLTGLHAPRELPILYPHVFGFPLQMAVLTDRAYPLPIWGALQIRNHLVLHRPIEPGAVLDLETRTADHRFLEKGTEIDLHTTVHAGSECVWESVNTFYYRRRGGPAGVASPLAAAPVVPDEVVARWRTERGIGWSVAGLTGDYNGIHYCDRYARLRGFRRAFHHPQIVVGACLAHLPWPPPKTPQRLDAWLKGPVYYDSAVALHARAEACGVVFAVVPEGEERPAILGRWTSLDGPRRAAR